MATVPAAKSRSQYWFVRIDGEKEFLRQKCGELSKGIDVEACLSGYHTGKTKENPHVHICLALKDGCTPQKQSLAVRIKSLFAIVKKSQYALDVWDNDRERGATSYIFHESDVEIFTRNGFSDSQLSAAQAANEAVQKVVALNRERAQNKLVEKARAHFEEGSSSVRIKPDKEEILLFMLKCIHKGENYHPGSFILKRYVEEVELMLQSEGDLEDYAANLAKEMWR